MNKVNGYTIPELVVAMVLSSILTVGIWTGYRFIVNQFSNFNQRSALIQELLILDNLLQNDINSGQNIRFDDGKALVILMPDNQRIVYMIEEGLVQREGDNIVDSFIMKATCTKVNYLEVDDVLTSNVTNISLEIFVNGRSIELVYNKQYDYCSLFNISSSHITN